MSTAPLVFASVGTDHHPFDRLVTWMEELVTVMPDLSVFVQHGRSRRPGRGVDSAPILPYPELQRLVATAAVVVTHGGPATIMDVRAAGRVPIVVPRRPDLGEHVDEHQVLFARRIAREGHIRLAEDRDVFGREVESMLLEPVRPDPVTSDVERAVSRFVELVTDLESRRAVRI